MDVHTHPLIAAMVLVVLAWFIHRALRPCKCCAHAAKQYDPSDF